MCGSSTCDGCDGACVETGHGQLCLASCTRDDECRGDEGYVCDPDWHACSLPNLGAIVPKRCPGVALHDKAFGDSELWGVGSQPSAVASSTGFIAAFSTTTGFAFAPDAAPIIGRDVVLARDAKTIFAAWRDAEAIELAHSADGASWSTPARVQADDGSELGRPMLAVGKDLLAVMYGEGDRGLRVRVSLDGGTTFATTVTPLAGTYGNAVIDDTGALHIVTLDGNDHGGYGSAMQAIEYTVSRDRGATFTTPLVVSGRDEQLPTYFANPSIAIDTRRKWLYIAYVRGGRDAAWEIVIAATRDAGKTWTRRTIGDGCAIHLVPNLALDAQTGTLHVAYYDNAGEPRFAHATCAIGATTCTPWGAINTQPFAAFTLGRQSPLSLGDRESLFVDHRVLHAVWTQPVIENGVAISRVFHASAKLR